MPAHENKFRLCDRDAVNRCQANEKNQQCRYEAAEGSDFCPRHVSRGPRNQALKNYRLGKWQARVEEFADSNGIKSLREEIGILRMIMEGMLDKCHDSADVLLFAPRITDLAMKIEKIVSSCHKLENATGMLLDKSAALTLAGRVVEIIGGSIKNPDELNKIADQIAEAIIGGIPSESQIQAIADGY